MKWNCKTHGNLTNKEIYAIYTIPIQITYHKLDDKGEPEFYRDGEVEEVRPHHLITPADVPELYCSHCDDEVTEAEDVQ